MGLFMVQGVMVSQRLSSASFKELLILLAFFVISRGIVFLVGIEFDASFLEWGYQLADLNLLHVRPFETLFNFHIQPPLFSAVIGLVTYVVPAAYTGIFHLFFLCTGFLLCFCMHSVLAVLGVRPSIRTLSCIVFMLAPSTILYEHWLFYTYPTALLLMLMLFVLPRYLRGLDWRYGTVFFSILALISLVRTLFHPVWMITVIYLVILACGDKRKVLLHASGPFCVVMLLFLKNFIVFGFFGASSLFGMSLSRIALNEVSPQRLEELVHSQGFDPIATTDVYRSLDAYGVSKEVPPPYKDIPVLTQEHSNRIHNFNHYAYLDISRRHRRNALRFIQMYPEEYLFNVVQAACIYLFPSSHYGFLRENREKLYLYEHYFDRMILWSAALPGNQEGRTGEAVTPSLLAILSLPLALGLFLRRREEGGTPACRIRSCVLTVMAATYLYVFLVSSMLEISENMRFRYLTVPYLFLMVGLTLERFSAAIRKFSGA